MTRTNVYLPDDLAERARAELPGVVLSQLLQEAVAAALDCCAHERVRCSTCSTLLDLLDLPARRP